MRVMLAASVGVGSKREQMWVLAATVQPARVVELSQKNK